jgi:hypothetical protein
MLILWQEVTFCQMTNYICKTSAKFPDTNHDPAFNMPAFRQLTATVSGLPPSRRRGGVRGVFWLVRRMSGLPESSPTFVSNLPKKYARTARWTDTCPLDGKLHPDSTVRTDAVGLRVCLGDDLSASPTLCLRTNVVSIHEH